MTATETAPGNRAHEAHRRILQMILDGTLKPGEILQEAALGDQLDMSRTPVREAIKRILSEGLAEVQGRFTRVRRLTPDDVDEIFFLRLVLEPACAREAINIDREALDDMEARIMALMRAGPGEDDVEWTTDNAFHRMICDAAGNRAIARQIADLHRRTCIFDHTQVPARFLKGCAEHLDIIDALRHRDGPRAEAAMRLHLTGARDAIFRRLDAIETERAKTE
ncbi:GntR family transcriptional regulator [Pseudooceanicola nanhaiensis]|uniref:GntR family transcriptional regulator n=1 Tax=Pseudooceanicola nanhaiensis TaxID=375761 RepID=UPI001CD5B63C|nr:GntR family transcriptional regulator [Pseudooceanicola nanhaiensis]MCA0921562.1 GntR family transcriptional regulator [Pseudooceanicola nanhaiensis]